jgi:hypothetical protein
MAWLVVGLLAALVVFFVGFLVGRAAEDEPATAGPAGGKLCRRAANLSNRLTTLHREALANRVDYTRALTQGDQEELQALNKALAGMANQVDELRGKAVRALDRCRGQG